MVGYIGQRAKRRKRNTFVFLGFIILVALGFYIVPSFRLNENMPSDSLLPSDEEIQSPEKKITIEELELKVFDKEQKIIFRNKEIKKLKNEIKILINENKLLSQSILDLKNLLDSKPNNKEEVTSMNKKINKITQDSKKELQKLDNIIGDITKEKIDLLKKINKINDEKDLLKKEYKSIVSKNLKSNNVNNELDKKIKKLQYQINEQNLLIKILEDTSHHR